MRPRWLFVALMLTVIGLGVLAAYLAYLLNYQEPMPQTVTAIRPATKKLTAPVGLTAETTPSPRIETASHEVKASSQGINWRSVETADYRTYITNLQAIGCAEETIRDIVIADVNRLYGSRRAELLTQGKTPKFWQTTEHLNEEQSTQMVQQLAALDREKTETIRSLLAIDPATEQRKSREGVTYPENRLGNLPPEKQDQVNLVRETFNEKWNRVETADRQPDEVSAELRRLDAERLAKLSEILTPDELLEHELQTSWTAIQLRNQLSAFQPSEEEFLKIYGLQKAFDNEYMHYFHGRTDQTAVAQKLSAQQELDTQLRTALGEQRYGEYLRARSGDRP